MDTSLFHLGRHNDRGACAKNGTGASSSSMPMHQQSLVPALLINIYRCRFDFCPQLYTFHLFFLHRPQIADMSTTFSLIQPITLSLTTLSVIKRMASNDNNGKRKMEEEDETSVVRKRLWLSNDNGGNDDSSDS
jgi:hypothetical protein